MALSKILPASQEQYAGARNLVANGAMTVSQRGTDFNNVASGTYTVDRYKLGKANTDEAVINIDQTTTAPDGFSNSLKISVGTAESALAADESLLLQHLIEAQNLQHLQNGLSGAKSVTLSFWVRSNKTGTYTASIRKPDNTDRNQSKEYTISAADTWEHKSITFSGDTSGGGIANDNGAGFFCDWWLAGGSNFTGGTMDTWANTATQRVSTNQVNLMDATNNWYITGVQLEVGEQATPFEHRSYADELRRCQRYYENNYPQGSAVGSTFTSSMDSEGFAFRGGAGTVYTSIPFKEVKRAAPTITIQNGVTGNTGSWRGSSSANRTTSGSGKTYSFVANSGTAGNQLYRCAFFEADAEL